MYFDDIYDMEIMDMGVKIGKDTIKFAQYADIKKNLNLEETEG